MRDASHIGFAGLIECLHVGVAVRRATATCLVLGELFGSGTLLQRNDGYGSP